MSKSTKSSPPRRGFVGSFFATGLANRAQLLRESAKRTPSKASSAVCIAAQAAAIQAQNPGWSQRRCIQQAKAQLKELRTVTIPSQTDHNGTDAISVTLPWRCIHCNGPRGEPQPGISYDGSRRLSVDTWINPCGHTEMYHEIRAWITAQEQAA